MSEVSSTRNVSLTLEGTRLSSKSVSSSSNLGETPALIRLFDSLVLAVVEQSKESNEKTRSFMSFWMSPYSMMCMITAVLMNRVIIFASSRYRRRLPYVSNIILRLFSIYLLFQGSYGLFLSLKCYYSNAIIQRIFRSDYFRFDDETYLRERFLSIPFGRSIYRGPEGLVGPTSSVLQNFHLSLCLSQVLDTFILVASGLKPSMETGITLFEYSLAFQEAQLDSKISTELLLVAFIALANQLNIHVLGLLDLLQYKLVTSSVIGLFTLSYYSYNIVSGNIVNLPHIIIVGYFPHFCIMVIIILSVLIFLFSSILRMSFDNVAVNNLLDNWNSMNISLSDDFYSALIRFGEFIINISLPSRFMQETSNILLPGDNYIYSELKSAKCLKNGYSNEVVTHPELLGNSPTRASRQRRSWSLFEKSKMLGKLFFNFFQLIKFNLVELMLLRKRYVRGDLYGDGAGNEDEKLLPARATKYRILLNDDGSFYYTSDDTKVVDIDDVDEEELDEVYPGLLLKANLIENDNSADYVFREEEETDDDYEEVDDIECNVLRDSGLPMDNANTRESEMPAPSSDAVLDLLSLQSSKEALTLASFDHQILTYHLQHLQDPASRLTRSHFAKYYTDDLKLIDLLIEKRQELQLRRLEQCKSGICTHDGGPDPTLQKMNDVNHEDRADSLGVCVICHENSRQIILWPCRCLAICEKCRVTLSMHEFGTCVCCRSRVDGYSKVYIP